MSGHESCDQPNENTDKGITKQGQQSSISENAYTQRRTPMHPLQRQGHPEMQGRMLPSFVPRNAPNQNAVSPVGGHFRLVGR